MTLHSKYVEPMDGCLGPIPIRMGVWVHQATSVELQVERPWAYRQSFGWLGAENRQGLQLSDAPPTQGEGI